MAVVVKYIHAFVVFFDKVFIDFYTVIVYNNKDMQINMCILIRFLFLADLYSLHFGKERIRSAVTAQPLL